LKRFVIAVVLALLCSGCVSVVKAPPIPAATPPKLAAKPSLPAVKTIAPGDKSAVACLDRSNLMALLERISMLEQDDNYARCAAGDATACKLMAGKKK